MARWRLFGFSILAAFLVLEVPLVTFLRHHSYGLLRPETLTIHGLTLLAALLFALVMTFGGIPGRIIATTALAVLLTDVQTDWITTIGLRFLLNVFGWGFLAWLVRSHLPRLLVWLAAPMLVVAVFTSGPPATVIVGEPGPLPGDDQDLPFVLHIILDEQIGPAGIPSEFDPDGRYANLLTEGYTARGFRVFERAYSRYSSTAYSLASLFNGDEYDNLESGYPGGFTRGDLLAENAWMDQLREAGYRFHVVQSSYLRFLDSRPEAMRDGDSAVAYGTHDLAAFEGAPLAVSGKIPFVLGTYFRNSYFLKALAAGYDRLMASNPGLPLPDWFLGGSRIGPLAAMNKLDTLVADLHRAGPGQAWVAHLMTPHFPYGWRGDCSLEQDVSRWLEARDYDAVPMRNTPESRAERYPLYLEQMRCVQEKLGRAFDVLEERGLWDDALVIVHGDHGSRISLPFPSPEQGDLITAEDFSDLYATFYAVKRPGRPGGADPRMLPIDHLFGREILQETAPGDSVLEAEPSMYLIRRDETMLKVAVPLPEDETGP